MRVFPGGMPDMIWVSKNPNRSKTALSTPMCFLCLGVFLPSYIGFMHNSYVRHTCFTFLYSSVRAQARQNGATVHFARFVEFCHEKGSELKEDDPQRNCSVLLSDGVIDQDFN